MKKTPVIALKNTPNGYGIVNAFFLATCLHYWGSALWAVILFPIIYVLFLMMRKLIVVEVNIFEGLVDEKEDEKKVYQSKFQEKLNQMAKDRGIVK